MSFRKSRAFSVIYMFVISAIYAGAVAAVAVATQDRVADNKEFAVNKSLVEVFELIEITPATTNDDLLAAIKKGVIAVWLVRDKGAVTLVEIAPDATVDIALRAWAHVDKVGRPLAYAFDIGGKGFWGPVLGLLAVEPDGVTIRSVVWTQHGETPGLGARIEEDQYRAKFVGRHATPAIKMVPDGQMGDDLNKLDAITGATQTTVVGLGSFLPVNFRQWQEVFPLVQRHFALRD